MRRRDPKEKEGHKKAKKGPSYLQVQWNGLPQLGRCPPRITSRNQEVFTKKRGDPAILKKQGKTKGKRTQGLVYSMLD